MERTETVTMVSVEWLMKNLTSFVDGFDMCPCENSDGWCPEAIHDWSEFIPNWEEMVESKYYECSQNFIDSVMTDGILNPICVVAKGEGFMHGNGHHRTALAILTAMDVIPVIFSFQDSEYMCSDLTGEYESKSGDNYGEW